ncbi:MAG: hypothetical protein ACR2QF_07250 [Geminicoccaceae bacterium]
MTIDERALEAAAEQLDPVAFMEGQNPGYKPTALAHARVIIEAYEAARWRPIEEAHEDRRVLALDPDRDEPMGAGVSGDQSNGVIWIFDDGESTPHQGVIWIFDDRDPAS